MYVYEANVWISVMDSLDAALFACHTLSHTAENNAEQTGDLSWALPVTYTER